MKKQKSIKVNFFMNALLMMSSVVFPLITSSHVARVLGPNGTGIVDFVYPMVMYFSMIAQLGIPTYGIRICAKVRDDKVELSRVVQELLIINMITCALAYICFFAAIALVPQMQEQKTLFYILGSLILLNTIGVEWLYKGLEEYSYITIRSLIFKVIVLICIVTMIQKESDYVLYGALFIMAQVGSNIVNFLHLHKIIIIKPVGGYHFKRHLKPIMSFFAMSIATTIYTSVDTTMIRFMKGYAENSFYSQSVKIKTALVNVVTALGAVLLPRASYYLEKGLEDEFLRISRKALHFIFVAAIPLSLYFMLAAKPSILFLFGDQYTRSITAMQLIMPTVFAIGLSNILGIQMLIPMGRKCGCCLRNCGCSCRCNNQCTFDSEVWCERCCNWNGYGRVCGFGSAGYCTENDSAAACASDSSLEACVGGSSIFDSMHSNSRNWLGEFCDIDGVCSSFLWHLPDCFNFTKGTIYTRVCAYGDKIFIA